MILPLANAAYNERSGKLTGKIRTSDRKCGRSPQRNDCKPMIVVQSRMRAASGPLTQRGIVPSITSLQTVRAIVGSFSLNILGGFVQSVSLTRWKRSSTNPLTKPGSRVATRWPGPTAADNALVAEFTLPHNKQLLGLQCLHMRSSWFPKTEHSG